MNIFQWLDYESWWLLFGGIIVVTSTFFAIMYIVYQLMQCCITSVDDEKLVESNRGETCKRFILNLLVAVIVFIDV